MARGRGIPAAVRELCLAFPEVGEFESHGKPNYRAGKGRIFAVWALNHHGDGHVALWLNTPAMEQQRLLASSRHVFKPPYMGPSGWIAVELDKGVGWKRVCELVHLAYLNSAPAKLAATVPKPLRVAAPTLKMKPHEIDRMLAPRAKKALAVLRRVCSPLPETEEGRQMGSVVWRTRKRSFAMLYDYGKGLAAQFWVGIERQGPLEMDPRFTIPPYMGHSGWMALDLDQDLDPRELRELALESYRHFASRRALAALDARQGVA
jgi:predicted DNA-binding protein (MmcQ/YjbR family)